MKSLYKTLKRGSILVSALFFLCLNAPAFANEKKVGLGELEHLISRHSGLKESKREFTEEESFEQSVPLSSGEAPVRFYIPGFHYFQCGQCHQGEDLIDAASTRMLGIRQKLLAANPDLKRLPLQQYIIQSYPNALLQEGQFAHATFDTIRVSPRSILIDKHAYNWETHSHETLHLAQSFLGHVNELEAYSMNALADPRFVILNFPYFENVVSAYGMKNFNSLTKKFFAKDVQENSALPRQVQWYGQGFDPEALGQLKRVIETMRPLFKEVSRLNRERALEIAYMSDRTGIPSIALDLVAAKTWKLPESLLSADQAGKCFPLLKEQMDKIDNTALGYKIDRKKEALLFMQYKLKINDARERLVLYFHFLKNNYVKEDGTLDLVPKNADDFITYVERQVTAMGRWSAQKGVTAIERDAARAWQESTKKELEAWKQSQNSSSLK